MEPTTQKYAIDREMLEVFLTSRGIEVRKGTVRHFNGRWQAKIWEPSFDATMWVNVDHEASQLGIAGY